jgi:hypothetical protein
MSPFFIFLAPQVSTPNDPIGAQLPFTGILLRQGNQLSNGTQVGTLQGTNVSGLEYARAQGDSTDWSDGSPPNHNVLRTWMGNVERIAINVQSWLGYTCGNLVATTAIAFTPTAPTFGSTGGTLTTPFALASGTYPIYFNGTSGATPYTVGTFMNGSTTVTWPTLDMSGSNSNAPSVNAVIGTIGSTRNLDPAGTYRASVIAEVAAAQADGSYVIIDQHWSGIDVVIGATTYHLLQRGQPQFANTSDAILYWTSISGVFGNAVQPQPGINNNAIAFELFNEPFIEPNSYKLTTTAGGSTTISDRSAALNMASAFCSVFVCGGTPSLIPFNWQLASYQSMVNAATANGSTNLCIINGNNYAQNVQDFLAYMPTHPTGNLAVGVHDYASGTPPSYSDGDIYGKNGSDGGYGTSAAINGQLYALSQGYPVISTESGGGDGTTCAANELYMRYTNLMSDVHGISRVRYRFTQTRSNGYAGPTSSDGPFQTVFDTDGSTILPIGGTGQASFDWQRGHRGALLINGTDCISPAIPHTSSGGTSGLGVFGSQWRSSQGVPSPTNVVTLAYDISYQTAGGCTQVKHFWNSDGQPNYDSYTSAPSTPYYNNPGAYLIQTNTAAGGTYPTTGWVTVGSRGAPYSAATLIVQNNADDIIDVGGGVNWVQLAFTAGNGSSANSDIGISSFLFDTTNCESNGGIAPDNGFFFMGDSITEHAMHYNNPADDSGPNSGVQIPCAPFPTIVRTGGFITAGSLTTAGSGYTPGTYKTVLLTGGTGSCAIANVFVNSSGNVVSVKPSAIIGMGFGFKVGDVLSVPFTQIGGSGTQATWTVTALQKPSKLQGYYVEQAPGGSGGWNIGGGNSVDWATYLTTQYTNLFSANFAGNNVCIQLGTNGVGATSNFVNGMNTVIALLQAAGKQVFIESPPPSPYSNSWLPGYVAAIPGIISANPGVLQGFNANVMSFNYLDSGLHPDGHGSVALRVGKAQFYSGQFSDQEVYAPPIWTTLKVGAGGFVRGLNIAPDGTMVARTDTNGAYLYNGFNWVQLFTTNSLPSSFVTAATVLAFPQGCFEIQIAPSNTQIFYAVFDGYVWVSSNQGTTWTQTAFAQNTGGMNPNDNYGQVSQRMAVDPYNSNIVFVGTENNGLYLTTNGGTSFTQIPTSSLPAGTGAGICGLLFNANGTVTGGVTQTIYAFVYGTGLYVSNNAGATWTATTGGPTTMNGAAIDGSGHYFVANSAGLYKYSGGTWSTLYTDGNGVQTVAINPFNNSEIAALRGSGWISLSYDGGATWSGANYQTTTVAKQIPWLVAANYNGSATNIFIDAGACAFSPTTNGELICSAGTGVWQTTLPSSGFTATTATSWNDFSVGIEQLVANEIIIAPTTGSTPLLVSWDRPFFDITNQAAYPATYGPTNSDAIIAGWSADYASSSPGTIAGIANFGTEESGITTNNGASWTAFAASPAGHTQSFGIGGGSIAASTPSNILWSPAGGVAPSYTTNGGTSWTQISISGISSWAGYQAQYYNNQRAVCADRVTANTFYLYWGGKGVYVSTNSGATWTQQLSGYIESNSTWAGYGSTIRSVPGNAGHLFYTPGNVGSQTFNNSQSVPFYRSTNSGVTWTTVSGVNGVQCFNFGAIAPGASYPSIYVVGYVNNVYGVYYSTDNATTWNSLGDPNTTLQTFGCAGCIAADPNNFGKVYVGLGGAGYAHYG